MSAVTVIKRDNTIEPFRLNKISKVVRAAGLTEKQADLLTSHISAWLKNINLKQLTSLQVRDQVFEELKTIDPYVANLYNWYQQTK